jgi:hypothetical protein
MFGSASRSRRHKGQGGERYNNRNLTKPSTH